MGIINNIKGFFSSSSNRDRLEEELNATYFEHSGHFNKGYYIREDGEEEGVYVNAPVFSYDNPPTNSSVFYSYTSGTMHLRNSSEQVSIELEQLDDYRIVPIAFCIGEQWFKVVNRNGKFKDENDTNFENISVGRTSCLILDILEEEGANENLKLEILIFMRELLIYNILVNKKVIVKSGKGYVYISNNHLHNFAQIYNEVFHSALKTMQNYDEPYEGANSYNINDSDDNMIELLSILELPSHITDLNIVKQQYRKLTKMYHPDLNKDTEDRMKEINVAYEEVCQYLKVSS